MPAKPIFTLSEYSGSYFSKDDGTIRSGIENNFKFPEPDILSSTWKDSVAFNSFLLEFNEILKSPTAPKKSSGLFSAGKDLTLTTFLFDETLLDVWV